MSHVGTDLTKRNERAIVRTDNPASEFDAKILSGLGIMQLNGILMISIC